MAKEIPLVLVSHKAEVTKLLDKQGLTPADFEWEDVPSKERGAEYIASVIKHRHEEYYCQIDRAANGVWVAEGCPGATDWKDKYNAGHVEHILGFVERWASHVAREFSAKDYLAIAMGSPTLIGLPVHYEDNTPLTAHEQEQMLERLDRIEKHLLGFREGDEDFRIDVQGGFGMLRDEIKRSGGTAFRYLVFSTLLSIGLAFLSSDETKQIIDFATQQISGITQLLTHSE